MRKYTIKGLGSWSFSNPINGFVSYLHQSLDLSTSCWLSKSEAEEKEKALMSLGVPCEEI